MKKLVKVLAVLAIACSLVACSNNTNNTDDTNTLKVTCTLDPHSKILEFAKPILAEKHDIELEIEVIDDYYIHNRALNEKEADANYFQHVPFFNGEVESNGYNIVNVAGVHIEPFGFYSKTVATLEDLPENAEVVISNSVADHGRILSILAKAGVIELSADASALDATVEDITSNPKNLSFTEINPTLLATAYEQGEGDIVAINGNYAIQAGLNPTEDAVLLEQADETNPYVNIVATHADLVEDARIAALVEVLKSDEVKNFIYETYSDGSVIPAN